MPRLQDIAKRKDRYQIDPRLLKVQPGFNIRDLDSPDERAKLDELKEQIRGVGVLQSLIVRTVGDDVVIVSGHRRHKVVMELIEEGEQIEGVPIEAEPPGTNDAQRVANIKRYNAGEPHTRQQDAELVRRLKGYQWDDAKIAQVMGWKHTNSVRQALDIAEFSQRLQNHVSAGHISATEARKSVKSVGDDKTCEIIEANLQQKTGKGSTSKPPRVKPADMARANPKKPSKAEQLAAERRQQALDALPAERRALVDKDGAVYVGNNHVAFEFVTDSEWREALGEPPQPDLSQAAAFSNGHAGTSEYSAPAEPGPLPTGADPVPPVAAPAGPQPEATPASASSDPQVAPAAEPDQDLPSETVSSAEPQPAPKPLTHLTNGAFFRAAEPIALLIEDFDIAGFDDDETIGINIPVAVAKEFLTAINRARGL